MNYMEQIAEMLGIKLYEDFKLKASNEVIFEKKFFLTEDGLFSTDCVVPVSTLLNDILSGKYEIVKLPQPLLTEEEKEYLSYVIKPFRDRIKYVYKYPCGKGDFEAIVAMCTNSNYHASFNFPAFEKNTMYKGMELMKEYTLEELGL